MLEVGKAENINFLVIPLNVQNPIVGTSNQRLCSK